jgi:hypothetical protein
MTTTIWYRQNHANSSSSDKSPLHAWSLGDTKQFRGELEQDFCEKMSTFGAFGDTKHSKENHNLVHDFGSP